MSDDGTLNRCIDIRNLAGSDYDFPEDDTILSKHVAAEW
jgi:hypothetical protein